MIKLFSPKTFFFWNYWKQIRQTWLCFDFKNPKSLARIEKTTTIYFSSKTLVFPKWFLSRRTIQFRQTCFTFLAGIWKVFCSNLTKRKNFFNIMSLKYSCGELEFSFDNHANVFPQKQQKLPVQCPKKQKKNTISLPEKSLVSLNGFSGHVQSSSVGVAPFFSWQLKIFMFEFFKNLKNFHLFFIRFLLRSRMQL